MRWPGPHPHPDEAVADTVGSILMVAVTVVMAVAMAALLLAFKGPVAAPQANLSLSLDPGAGGWGTGDESIRVTHNGGEALAANAISIAYTLNGARTVLAGAALGGPFAGGGALNLGETWSRTLTVASTDTASAAVVASGASSVLLASATLVPGQLGGSASCVADTVPPTVQFLSHAPALTATSPTSTVTVTLVVQDNCTVNTGVAPLLEWGYLSQGTFPTSVAMAFQGGAWTGVISPAQVWALHAGDTLQYRVSGYKDAALNTGATAGGGDLIDVAPPTYPTVQTATVVAATVPAIGTVQAADGTEGGFAEAASITSGQVAAASASGTVATGVPANVLLAPDDLRAGLATASQSVTATGFTAPGGGAGISHVTIGFEGRKSAGGGTDPTVTLSYTVGGVAGASSATKTVGFFSASAPQDATYTLDVSLDRAWTAADLANLAVKVQGATFGGRNAEIDQVFVLVTYAGAGTPRTLALQYDWGTPNLVPTGLVQTLEMRYRVTASADTFTVQVYDFTAGTWRSCATQLTATTAPPTVPNFACALGGAGEFNSGAPRVRILDNSAASTTATTLSLDYVRVVTT